MSAEVARFHWSDALPEREWALYRHVMTAAAGRGIRFVLGGGLAFSWYAHRWRDTKDIDLYILPQDRQAMVDVVLGAGFKDYHDQKPYDRRWIFRSYREGVIVDVIWRMANRRADVEQSWLERGPQIDIRGTMLQLLAPEELVWTKLYVMQRDRCDWPDLLNVLFMQGRTLDWHYLLRNVGEDAPVLGGLLSVLGWMCPARARDLPEWIWPRVGVARPSPGHDCGEDRRRVRFLDSREWFGGQP